MSAVAFALNHMTAPRLDTRAFLDLAASLGCAGVELRNDLADKKLSEREFFDGDDPSRIGDYAREKGLRLLGLSEVYGFNHWSPAMRERVVLLLDQAKASGAETISLIPDNSGNHGSDTQRLDRLERSLSEILPLLDRAGMVALVEPLGFLTSSLRFKREAVSLIDAIGGSKRMKLVHDTFHHHLAGETEYFPDQTGMVHISGVTDHQLGREQMGDEHRILVDENDQLDNIGQIRALFALGYQGPFSMEAFAPSVHASPDIAHDLRQSFDCITNLLQRTAA